jgi:hypothetical protein
MSEDDVRGGDAATAVVEELDGHLADVFDSVPGGVYLYLDTVHKVNRPEMRGGSIPCM